MTIDLIRKSLGNKILATVTLGILLIMGLEIIFRIYFGTKDRIEQMEILSGDLAASTYSGIKHPMSVGDSDAVERVLADVRLKMDGMEVFICDTDQQIIWSTHEGKIHTPIADSISSPAALAGLQETLHSGQAPLTSYEEKLENRQYLINVQAILNERDCVHCHGASKKIIGGMVIRANMERPLEKVAAAMKRSLFIMIFGLSAIFLLIYALVERFIRRPVASLSQGVKRVTDGELDFEIQPGSSDEIGDLAKSFNQMTKELKNARQEINTWTDTLEDMVEERTVQLKQAMDGIIQSEKMASLGRLAAIVAHEINNPLAGIRTYAKLLLKKGDEIAASTDPRFVQYLQTIESESARCGEIIRNLLQFARPDKPQFTRQDTNTLIQECLRLIQHKINLQNIELQLALPDESMAVNCDGQKIKQALLALLLNACDALEPEGGVVEVRSRSIPEKQGVEISIRDNGIGMNEETRAHMFEPFFTTKIKTPGPDAGVNIGLGLTVVYEIIKAHRGEITVHSEPDEGSTITIFLHREPGPSPLP
ncbi:MAG: hypothetical protein A2521_14870 [Deltaproteobacteria bacterium RIFOXYD12_FULL_57_12]|nr:MAG: hypothetical protein A2521_14870 [Deltaproteobacteria bacterium RIFOXYD12_FULL_57_12]